MRLDLEETRRIRTLLIGNCALFVLKHRPSRFRRVFSTLLGFLFTSPLQKFITMNFPMLLQIRKLKIYLVTAS